MTIFFEEKTHNEIIIHYISLAPGAYDVDKADKKIHESSPAYSIGIKHKEQKPDDIPGNQTYIVLRKIFIIS